ncbi:ParB/RepB/Spo0J family partition protein [Lentzea tibetensis]|uniref:ParB/RepB/Spo0J family partition protein n=1 Tax=Lentzea tibetensis TaxID=2591470 RepID=UPI001C9A122E|nr:ParB/RepB/Spo0J family partition protein [Lentzea tibetensis]
MLVPISELRPSDSPRLSGESCAHARTLAESDAELPPLLVHRPTMRVIDGMHRLQAATLRGERAVLVRFYDGAAADAFVLAVKANVAHGLPLSVADRRAAALRIIASHPQWSDRAIAEATGLTAKTIGSIRRCATGEDAQLRTRIGRDGRARPLSSSDGRLRACALMREKPDASLRQIAGEAGISLGTVRDVRDRLARGEDPVPRQQRDRRPAEPVQMRTEDVMSLLVRLKRDPSLRFTETGRSLIRLLSLHALGEREREQLLDSVPAHCRRVVAELAHACAQTWQEIADKFECR